MKLRKWILLFVLLLCIPICAAAQPNHVYDQYGLLDADEAAALEQKAAALSREYGCGLYILVVHDYTDYASSTFSFAIDTFEAREMGMGSDKTGVLLMLSMADRDYELLFHGKETDTIFTEYGRDKMEERFLDEFRYDNFYEGFHAYLDCCGEYLEAARQGHPFDRQKEFSVLFFLPGILAAVITGIVLYAPMKSAVQKQDADDYLVSESLKLHHRTDLFVNRTVVRTPKESSSSGGSSHRSGSYSGRSGKF